MAAASGVSYDIKFTGASTHDISGTNPNEGGVLIGFCSNSPLINTSCTHPAGLDTTGVSVTNVKYNGSAASGNGSAASLTFNGTAHSGVKWTAGADYTGGQTLEMTLTGIHNPTAAGTFYVRMTTYSDDTTLAGGTTATSLGTYMDDGAVALSTTSAVGVTAYVLESMTFCVSKGNMGDTGNGSAVSSQAAPSENCGSGEASCPADPGCVIAPSMTLGQQSGAVNALSPTAVSTGQTYAQLSTNAASGAIVNLKSDATSCGGLYRNGNTANCNIAPQTSSGSSTLVAGVSDFGLIVGSAAAAPLVNGSGGTGSGTITTGTGYDSSHYFIDYVAGNGTGVTSTFGSEIFHSTAPVNNMNVPVTFGASISPTTPAGIYGATLNMIATGTF
ncbi:MAG TPA: hypothetical protein VLF40_03045 [Candidatus Saccharimonadales bacterium]|nr:hypothetical protein [Candidatus Saccharimonadales bacterium]